MLYAIMGIVFGLCLFILPLWAYRKGVQDGLSIQQGKPIAPIQKPLTKANKASDEVSKFIEGINNIMAYDGETQKGVDT
jgi:hypothetical protein